MPTVPKSFRTKVIILRVLAVVVMLPSLLALAVSHWAYDDSHKFLSNAATTEGKVVVIKKDESTNLYTPVISFRDKEHKSHSFAASIATPNPSYEVDETVPLVYDIDDPTQVRIDYWATHWGFALMAFTVFILGVIIATILWIVVPAIIERKLRIR